MRLQYSVPLLAAALTVSASTPFIFLSTSKAHSISSQQLQTSSRLEDSLISTLTSKCSDSNLYLFMEHPGLLTSDLRHSSAMPHLQQRLKRDEYKSIAQIPEIVGEVDIARVAHAVSQSCRYEEVSLGDAHSGLKNKIIYPALLPALKAENRADELEKADEVLETQLKNLIANHTSHTIIYVGSPAYEGELRWEQEDEPPFHEGMHTDLKRDVAPQRRAEKKNPQDDLPLFEKYQFLSPGIFMGLTVFLLLFIILYVGITAIAGLEVSYMAFSKEMGPQAQSQKKQQ